MAEAESSVHKDLRLDRRIAADEADFLKTEFACKDDPRHAHLLGSHGAGQIMDAHLCAGMDR